MSLDPYSLCPCGSGKKLKFCCADIANDMMKALQLHEGGQSKAALKILEKLHEQQPTRAWVATSLAGILMFLEEPEAAREALQPLLQENPDHPLGRILDATATLDLFSFEQARPAIHRAFTKGFKQHPEMIGSLAAGISAQLFEENRYMAARQHLTFAMRFVREEDRQAIFMRMLDLDSDEATAYPLRGVHHLKSLELSEADQATYKKATSLSSLGCWHEAAKLTTQLLEKNPDNTNLWYNTGLFHAWDGNQSEAAICFHRAAEKSTDREFAIASETLAQILDLEEDQVYEECVYFKAASLSRLLSTLDDQDRIVRDAVQDPQAAMEITSYVILDKAPGSYSDQQLQEGQIDQLPLIKGRIQCFEISGTSEPTFTICRLYVSPENKENLASYLQQATGDQLTEIQENPAFKFSGYSEYRDYDQLYPALYVDAKTWKKTGLPIEQTRWKNIIQESWPNLPLTGLQGKTPAEAKNIPELSVKLAAAVNVFDVFACKYKYALDVEALKTQLGLPQSEPYLIENDAQINSCDVLEMLRIPVENLSEAQLEMLINRAQLIQHPRFTDRVMSCILKYPQIVDEQRFAQILHAYIDLARDRFDRDAALERIQIAKKWAAETDQKFEETIQWEMRELQFRVYEPEAPEFKDFLNNFYARYIRKFPELEELITGYLAEQGITPPWPNSSGIVAVGSGSTHQSVWAPDVAPAQAPGKLWLPGQD